MIQLLFVIDFLYTSCAGTETQLLRLIRNLNQDRFHVRLVSLRDTEWIRQNAPALPCPVKTYNVEKLKNPLTMVQFLHLTQYMKACRPDIVMTFFPLSNIAAVLAARLARVPVILSTRRDYGLWLNPWTLPLLRLANRFVIGIVVNSKSVQSLTSKMERVNPSIIRVIYNGLDLIDIRSLKESAPPLRSSLGIPRGHFVVGIVANLRPMKRHKTLLKAAARILRARKDVHFVLVGEGPLRNELETTARDFGISHSCHFVGRQENVSPFLSIFDIGVNCSANEGLSNAIMEYMACGIPCVVSRAGGNPELIEHGVNGYTFELDDDRSLAELILRLLDDPETCFRFSERSKEIVLNRMTTERMVKQYEDYFCHLLAKAQGSGHSSTRAAFFGSHHAM